MSVSLNDLIFMYVTISILMHITIDFELISRKEKLISIWNIIRGLIELKYNTRTITN